MTRDEADALTNAVMLCRRTVAAYTREPTAEHDQVDQDAFRAVLDLIEAQVQW